MSRVNPITAAPDALQTLTELTRLAGEDLQPALAQLVSLQVSLLNGCAYCTGLHRDGALAAGQPAAKLAALPAWSAAPDFTPEERAALALADHLTRPTASPASVPADVHAEATTRLGDSATARLMWTIAATNAWNRIGIASATPAAEPAPSEVPSFES